MVTLENLGYTPSQIKILKNIHLTPGITRKRLSELTGISGRSVLKYVSEFLESGIIINYGTKNSTGGRNAARLAINPDYLLILSVDIGSYCTKCGVVNMHGEIIKEKILYKKEKHQMANFTPQMLKEELANVIEKFGKNRFLGIGIGITGIVNNEKNIINFSPNIPNFTNINITEEFETPLGLPVYLDTSARCSVLAEQKYGYGNGFQNQVFISVGHSISAGIITNNHLFTGSGSNAGEIGHIKCGNKHLRCTCGNYDCLEIYSTLPMIIASVKNKLLAFSGYSPAASLLTDPDEFDWQEVVKGIEMKDKIVMEEISNIGKNLGYVVSALINIINPDIIVFGGSVTELIPNIIDKAIESINEFSLISSIQNLEIKKSALGSNIVLLGSAVQVTNNFFCV